MIKRKYGIYTKKPPKRYIGKRSGTVSTERLALENEVYSYNKHLKYQVRDMSFLWLLSFAHPSYRKDHARALYEDAQISKRLFDFIVKDKVCVS